MSVQAVNSNFTFSGGIVSPEHLTPEGLVIYMQTRLGAIDEQINAIMDKQTQSEAARKAAQEMLNILASCPEDGGDLDAMKLADGFDLLAETLGIEASHAIEKDMPESIQNRMGDGNKDGNWGSGYDWKAENPENPPLTLSKDDLSAAKTYFQNMVKDIESGAELDMIKLQSLMASRNTAISLATNSCSSLGKSQEQQAGSIGR